MADVQWIKIKVGMFDGNSFRRIKRAKIGGEKFRDKLTAVWFELMDFAGACNHGGAFIDKREIPYKDLADIATMIDREPEELELCMTFFINEGMVEIVDDVYQLSNWVEYQNEEALGKIREQKRIAQAKWRAKKALGAGNVDSTVDSTGPSTEHLPSYSLSPSMSSSKEMEGDCKGETRQERHKHGEYGWVLLTDQEYERLVNELGLSEAKRCIAYVDEAAQGTGNKNKWKDWNLVVRKCHREGWGQRQQGRAQRDTGFETGNPFLEMLNERRGHHDL